MTPTRRLVLASSNAGKLAELRPLLADTGLELVAQSELGVLMAHPGRITGKGWKHWWDVDG